ncbi:unnamed protein product [Paramecium sonneborni]|uniref:Uncharacterized protein n=1 Tax=Paramecium sonneborni TaxID=65129 RepID=A0A8S1R054_9CILI|nr:unnamed protein product [Paramecium sonneborni]
MINPLVKIDWIEQFPYEDDQNAWYQYNGFLFVLDSMVLCILDQGQNLHTKEKKKQYCKLSLEENQKIMRI